MSLAKVRRFLGLIDREQEARMAAIHSRREELFLLPDEALRAAAARVRANPDVVEVFALAAVVAERLLGLKMFEVQIAGALALQRGAIAEMQTGEGKTLAAVPAVICYALHGRGIHVLTANDYLARRDAAWMGGIYQWFGLSVAHIAQHMSAWHLHPVHMLRIHLYYFAASLSRGMRGNKIAVPTGKNNRVAFLPLVYRQANTARIG